jgi:taurine dioxygenase
MDTDCMLVKRLTPRIGAEVLNIDVNHCSDQQVQLIRQALLDNLVIFFRGQTMTPKQLKEFGEHFGKLAATHNPRNRIHEHPEVTFVVADENSKNVVGENWHSDGTADEEPPMGSILYLIEVPPDGGGDTVFANAYLAYETLPQRIKTFLEGLTAVNDRRHALRGQQSGLFALKEGDPTPCSEHPIVRIHPETGRKLLYVNRAYTSHIPELEPGLSDALLKSLFDHIEQPIFQCRFSWGPGSIAFWDNRCAQHYAVWDYFPHRRYGHRVTIAGDKPRGVSEVNAENAGSR